LFYGKQYRFCVCRVRPDFFVLATAFGIKAVDLSVRGSGGLSDRSLWLDGLFS
jgi:hypothetical protein